MRADKRMSAVRTQSVRVCHHVCKSYSRVEPFLSKVMMAHGEGGKLGRVFCVGYGRVRAGCLAHQQGQVPAWS